MQGKRAPAPPFGYEAAEPRKRPEVQVPPCPKNLRSDLEKQVWQETAAVMVANGNYGEDCSHVLQAYCVQAARWLLAEENIAEFGLVNKNNGKGRRGGDKRPFVTNPWFPVSNSANDRMLKLASELCLTPLSRKKAAKSEGDKAASPRRSEYLTAA